MMMYLILSGSCGGEYFDSNGHMSSPSYPNNYPGNADCIYTLSQRTDTFFVLKFLSMDILLDPICHLDYLEIRDGPTHASPLLARLCGNDETLSPIQSSQNHVWMK